MTPNQRRLQARDARGLRLAKLSIGAVGVVYGDIGTSPLYSVRECFGGHGVAIEPANVYGVISLVFWSLLVVVSVKYLIYVLRADNEGEGGILALLALIMPRSPRAKKKLGTVAMVLLALFGTGLLYGDAIITPAISVLSAVEGLQIANHLFEPLAVPISVVILFLLFGVQRWGTGRLGALFGVIMITWFATIAYLGARAVAANPVVLWAVSPHHAVRFFFAHGTHGFVLLGSVVLVVTGSEALYADMGHFGRRAIRVAWFGGVYPALLLNYFGQGAILLAHPEVGANAFFALVPREYLYLTIALATAATVVASQALISGAFSLSHQAVQLGYLPRLTIVHTSGREHGQVYIPEINELMMVGCIGVVLGFGSSSALAAAYGAAVTGTMTITSVLFYAVMRDRLGRKRARRLLVLFLLFDLAFLGANALKIQHGGWFPLAIGALLFLVMTTWSRGRAALGAYVQRLAKPLSELMGGLQASKPHRVPGSAVFMSSNPDVTPPVLLHHLRHNKVLHERVVLLFIATERTPEVPEERRIEITDLGEGVYHVRAHYGFMQIPNVPALVSACRAAGLELPIDDTTFYLGRESLLPTGTARLARWRKRLFMFLSRNARPATYYYAIPPERVVEIGMQVEL
jgi:KUP system potassium uptake protein